MTTIPRPPREPLLTLELNRVGHRCVLQASGELDIAGVPKLTDGATAAVSDGAQELWVDLTAVEFLDVLGAHALVAVRDLAATQGRRLAVICPGGAARRALELTRTIDDLPVYASRSDAHRLA